MDKRARGVDGQKGARRERIESSRQPDRGLDCGAIRGWRGREGRRVIAQALIAVEDGEGDRVGGKQRSHPEEKPGQSKKAAKGDHGDGQWGGVLEISSVGDGAESEDQDPHQRIGHHQAGVADENNEKNAPLGVAGERAAESD
jgi:hypothetical protein